MSAMIEERVINGKSTYSFAEHGAKQRAWHGLGDDQQIFDRPMFVKEALEACHANYNVQTNPVAVMTDEVLNLIKSGKSVDSETLKSLFIPNTMATIRTDINAPLGIVSDKYGVVSNELAFKFVDTLCSGNLADRDNTPVIETCGVLGKGERVFVTAKFPKQVVLDAKRDDLMDMYLNGHLDKIILTYTHFKSAGSQRIVDEVLLPVSVPAGEAEEESDYILEPSAEELMKVLLPKVIRTKVYCAMLDSYASEQAARVIAMQAATENADKLIGELTLQYNKLRQQAITNEILDLAGGAQNN